jgi:ribosomal protein L37AE/L43A
MSATEDPKWTPWIPGTEEMTDPVRCTHCGGTYDLAAVTRTRVGSCAIWNCPGCGHLADDRGETMMPWKSMKDYVRLDRS